ncbi:MAG TPA: hypothetical protein VJB69_02825 [Candidatus Paceibacterota bacterium]
MKRIIIGLILVFALSVPALGADYLPKGSLRSGAISVSEPKIYHNLYLGGGNISIDAPVTGDLVVAGGGVNIGATVEKDLLSAGGNININASVGDDVRIAGGNVSVNAPIGGDLLLGGGTVNVSSSTTIDGDFWVGAGILNLNGIIRGEARIVGSEILINGVINGDLNVRAEKQLVFGPRSRVLGKINYSGPTEAIIESGAQVGQINFTETTSGRHLSLSALLGIAALIKLLAFGLVGLIAWRWFRPAIVNIIAEAQEKPWGNLGRGFVVLIIWPLVTAITLVTVIGSYLGAILLLSFLLTIVIATVMTVFFLGSLVEKWIWHKEPTVLTWPVLVWGLIMGLIFTFVPIVGWLTLLIAYLITLGSLLQTFKRHL